jgi:hypothetical protein
LEALEKYQYTDYASELRRSIQRLKEGGFFVKMMSDLDILERQKRNNSVKFWKDEKTANRYTLYLTTVQKIEALTTIVENYEDELSLACMNLTAYRPQMIEKIKTWESDYFDYKVELFNRVNPQSNQAKFYLIGSKINDFYEFYKPLFYLKNYQFKCQLIWYREAYFNEMVVVKKEVMNDNGITEMVDISEKREKYTFTDFDENSAKRYAGEDSDKLVGMEISITGICPALFLFQENGLHEWGISDNLTAQSFIFVQEGMKDLNAKDLHSPTYWKRKKARRIYKNEYLSDAPFEINREIPRNKYLDYLLPILNKRFENKLNEVLL